MSIIQEALKKAQGGTGKAPGTAKTSEAVCVQGKQAAGSVEGPDRPAAVGPKTPVSDHDRKAVVWLVAILVIVAFFAAGQFLPKRAAGISKSPDAEVAVNSKAASASEATTGKSDTDVKRSGTDDFPALPSIVFKQPEEKAAPGPEFALNGIMYLEGSPRAIINDSMVGIGDVVSGAKVIKIEKRYVVLQYRGSEISLDLK